MTARKQSVTKPTPHTDESVYQAIVHAMMQGELKAGTKLAEHKLAEIFGVSRERIRKVLHRLGAERRIEIVHNRGARVARPTLADIKAVYEAHRVLEAGVLAQLSRILTDDILARLDAHLVEERDAAERGDRAASVRLSGAFHIHLVDALGNAELSRFLRDLLSRSSVMVSIYEPATQSACAVDEHGAILAALRARDVPRAMELSREHFLHVEQRLRPDFDSEPTADLRAVFTKASYGEPSTGRAKKAGKASSKHG
jgi:DNA-binding GntR family transcriptional regulator